jgi:hypothetical protein
VRRILINDVQISSFTTRNLYYPERGEQSVLRTSCLVCWSRESFYLLWIPKVYCRDHRNPLRYLSWASWILSTDTDCFCKTILRQSSHPENPHGVTTQKAITDTELTNPEDQCLYRRSSGIPVNIIRVLSCCGSLKFYQNYLYCRLVRFLAEIWFRQLKDC